jgi:predicted O-methyltransferase YrrM
MTIKDRILALCGPGALKLSALNIRDGEGVFRSVLQGAGYKHVLEIGTFRGVSAACMAQYVDRVTTIDLHHGRIEQLGQTWDRRGMWEQLGIDNIDLRLVNDDAEKAEIVNSLDFDFAFVDGCHDSSVANDFALVKRCGAVLFHDYDRRGRKELDYVADFIDTLPKHQLKKIDIFALWKAAGHV